MKGGVEETVSRVRGPACIIVFDLRFHPLTPSVAPVYEVAAVRDRARDINDIIGVAGAEQSEIPGERRPIGGRFKPASQARFDRP